MKARFRSLGPCADDHVIVFRLSQQLRDILRLMLAVPVHQHDKFSLRRSNAGLDGGSIADVVGVTDHVGAGFQGNLGATVNRTVDNDDYFRLRQLEPLDLAEHRSQCCRFVEDRNNNRDDAAAIHEVDRRHGRGRET